MSCDENVEDRRRKKGNKKHLRGGSSIDDGWEVLKMGRRMLEHMRLKCSGHRLWCRRTSGLNKCEMMDCTSPVNLTVKLAVRCNC